MYLTVTYVTQNSGGFGLYPPLIITKIEEFSVTGRVSFLRRLKGYILLRPL